LICADTYRFFMTILWT